MADVNLLVIHGKEVISDKISHLDNSGNARMVDVGGKSATHRIAEAESRVLLSEEILNLISEKDMPKGDVLAVARIAGIQAAKRSSELIPLCHPIPITSVSIDIKLHQNPASVIIRSRVETTWITGVEMEALSAVTVAALTIYDMCKSIEKGIEIDSIRLVSKSGGKSGDWQGRVKIE